MKNFHSWRQGLRDVFLGLLLVSVITAIWSWSYKTVALTATAPLQNLDKGGFFTAVFGAASIALFILSLLIATFASLGWQLAGGEIEGTAGVTNKAPYGLKARASTFLWKWLRDIFITVTILSVITAIWSWSFKTFAEASATHARELDQGSLYTALFGASSIALFILSLLVAILAVLGWQTIKSHIEKKVAEGIAEKTRTLESELKGRVATVLGYALGEMSLKPRSFDVDDKDRLDESVRQCTEGYRLLQKVGGSAEALALNNLLFYSCLYAEGTPKENSEFMLEKARSLRDAGQKYNSTMLKLTACRVLLEYGDDPQERTRAREILRAITDSSFASTREKKEALFYLNVKYPAPWESW